MTIGFLAKKLVPEVQLRIADEYGQHLETVKAGDARCDTRELKNWTAAPFGKPWTVVLKAAGY